MRALILMMAAAGLAVVIGCDTQNQNNNRELAEAPVSAPRANLYPLTSPPPGTVQPLQGYAPTRISASQYEYGPAAGGGGAADAQLAMQDPAALQSFGYSDPAAATAPAAYNNSMYADDPARQSVYAAAVAAGAAMTYPPGQYPGQTAAAATFASYTPPAATTLPAANGATYNPNDPNDPYYCPPGAEFCPVPGSPAGASTIATPADSFGLPAAVYASAPAPAAVTAPVHTAPVMPVVTTPAYTTVAASYTPPVIPEAAPAPAAMSTSYTPPATSYAPPVRLSSTAAYAPPAPAYTPPAYTPPAYTPPPARTPAPAMPSYPYQSQAPVGMHYGAVEGTADIVGPLPSLDPVVRPAFGGGYSAPAYPAAPNYGAPHAQPLSVNVQTPAPASDIYAMAPAAPAPSARRPLLASAQPVSAVAGISVPAGDTGGYRLVPALDVPPGNHPNDFGPSQWFEVVRPGNGAVRVGRISATCVCVGARIPKRSYGAGERILVEARMLSKPAANNLTYGLYVNIVEPVETVVDADVTLRY